ncbi:thymidylate synthase, partial [Yoonia sp.]|uniref:thymidylate synthase n=1 Tax=Yoonia sp. TaxID=2212373 RepID=UPI0019F40EB7
MKIFACALAAAVMLSACDDVTVADGGTGGDTPATPAEGVEQAVKGTLDGVTFNAAAETLLVTVRSLDGDTVATAYARNNTYDQDGYIAFTQQDDALDRFFTGMAATSADGTSQAVVVMDGGQFNRYFGGVNYAQIGTYTAPTSGLASYAGDYVGLLNVGTRTGTLSSGASNNILPYRSGQVTGDIFLNVDFADNKVNGAIYNRVDVDSVGINVDTVFLPATALNADGSFA